MSESETEAVQSLVEAMTMVCEVANEWAGEYGFGAPEYATEVKRAVYVLCPGVLDQRDRDYFAAEMTPAHSDVSAPVTEDARVRSAE